MKREKKAKLMQIMALAMAALMLAGIVFGAVYYLV